MPSRFKTLGVLAVVGGSLAVTGALQAQIGQRIISRPRVIQQVDPRTGLPVQAGQPVASNQPTAQERMLKGEVYRSQRWMASFHLEETLQLPQFPGLSFAGARIVAVEPGSPVTRLGLGVGDVITRLDGRKVDTGKWPNQDGCYWMLPQLERHFNVTTVRFIRTGTTTVVNQPVDLGPRCRPQRFPSLSNGGMLP